MSIAHMYRNICRGRTITSFVEAFHLFFSIPIVSCIWVATCLSVRFDDVFPPYHEQETYTCMRSERFLVLEYEYIYIYYM
jgi:hypothetical protein